MSTMKVFVSFPEYKIKCKCGFSGYERLDFVRPNAHCTIRFEKFIYLLTQKMTISDVSKLSELGWSTVKSIDIYYIKQNITPLSDITPVRLGVDEVAYEKGHNYLTVIRDLDLNSVIWIGLNRTIETLDSFFNDLGVEKQSNIRLFVMDMWDPYITSVNNHCKKADIVFDKFHIIKKVNESLDEVRKQVFSKGDDDIRKRMKKKRFLILRRKKNLDEKQKESLNELMKDNSTLYHAYLLKEQISDIFDDYGLINFIARFDIWKRNAISSGIESFNKVIKTIERYFYGVCNYFIHRVTNAQSEGFNTKINIIRRKAYGYWDLDYFILKIFQGCGWFHSPL